MPETPTAPNEVLETLDERGSDATMAMTGPRFFGFVIGGSLPVVLAANWLAGAWDQCSSYYKAMPATSYIEQVALRWILELFHLPPAAGGGFVTGGTMANFSALAAARQAVLRRAGWDVEADGLAGSPPVTVTVMVSEEVHPSLMKSLGPLGFGRNRVVRVRPTQRGACVLHFRGS